MEKEFIPYEQVLALKELGFDKSCFGYYNIDPQLKNPAFNMVKPFEHIWCLPAPLYQQAFRWFRETHGLYSSIIPKRSYDKIDLSNDDSYISGLEWYIEISGGDGIDIGPDGIYSYSEAELACLKQLIEIVKK